jgi:hypothetical protein
MGTRAFATATLDYCLASGAAWLELTRVHRHAMYLIGQARHGVQPHRELSHHVSRAFTTLHARFFGYSENPVQGDLRYMAFH